jgi:TRAP-type C4-dicarboxylate transport system substrate-binding protein
MSRKVERGGARWIFALAVTFMCITLTLPVKSSAAALTADQIRDVVKESMQLLIKGNSPTGEQERMIQNLSEMIKSGEVSKGDIHKAVKKQISTDLEQYEISRYEIGNMLERAPKLLPSVTSEDLDRMLWEKVGEMIKEPIILKIGTLAPEGTSWIDFPRKVLNPRTEKVSEGKVIPKMYTGGVMGEDVDILRKMDMGQLDGCGCTALGFFKAAPEVSVFSLPRLFRNYDEVDHILKTFRKDIDAAFEKRGYVVDDLIDTGFFYLWSKENITTLDEIKKSKVLTWFGTIETSFYDELGIRPTPVAVPEVVTSLNTGLVNVNCGPAPWMLGTQAYNSISCYVTQPLFYSPAAVIYSKKMLDQFRGKYPDTLIHNFSELRVYEARTLEREWIEQLRVYEKKCLNAFETKAKIKPVRLSEQDMATIDAASKRVWDKLAGELYPKELLDRILKELEAFRKK